MATLVKSIKTGERIILGTKYPVESLVEKDKAVPGVHGGDWLVTLGVCNGTAEGTKRFRTKKAALAFLEESCGDGV